MKFTEALKILNIEDFKDRIWNSNSRGELSYLADYIILAQRLEEYFPEEIPLFRKWFLHVVKEAEKTWERPESIFQHIMKVFLDHISKHK